MQYGAKVSREDILGKLASALAGSNAFVLQFKDQSLAKTENTMFDPPK